jgi:hypothetical protein
VPSSNLPTPQAAVGSGRRPQATARCGGGFRGSNLRRACIAGGRVSKWAVAARGSHHASSRGEARCPLDKGGAREGDPRRQRDVDGLQRIRGGRAPGSVSARRKRSCRSR